MFAVMSTTVLDLMSLAISAGLLVLFLIAAEAWIAISKDIKEERRNDPR